MNKILIITFLIIFSSCGSSKRKTYPEYVIGINSKFSNIKIHKDSLYFVTPNIEIYNSKSYSSEPDYDKRKSIRDFVIKALKFELSNTKCYNLPLMYKDYLTVNKILEGIIYTKWKNPSWIVKAPDEILISDKKYTLLVSMTARYGVRNGASLSFTLVNNAKKIIESVYVSRFIDSLHRLNYIDNPLDTKQIRKRIKAVLPQIIY